MVPVARIRQVIDGHTPRFVELYGREAFLPSQKGSYSHEVIGALAAVPAGSLAGGRALD